MAVDAYRELKMDWEAIAALAEVIGTVVIVVSVVYLAIQVRQNTQAVKSSTRSSWVSAMQTSNELAAAHSELWHKAQVANQELTDSDRTLFLTIWLSGIDALESLYLEYNEGNVEESFWESKRLNVLWFIHSPMGRWAWEECSGLLDKKFVDFINTQTHERDTQK